MTNKYKYSPTKSKCPNCHSTHFHFRSNKASPTLREIKLNLPNTNTKSKRVKYKVDKLKYKCDDCKFEFNKPMEVEKSEDNKNSKSYSKTISNKGIYNPSQETKSG